VLPGLHHHCPRIILPVVGTIGHLRIDWAGRVEILVYDWNRFIRAWICDKFKEVKHTYQRWRIIAAEGHRHATGTCSQNTSVKQMGNKIAYFFGRQSCIIYTRYVRSKQGCCQQYGEQTKRQPSKVHGRDRPFTDIRTPVSSSDRGGESAEDRILRHSGTPRGWPGTVWQHAWSMQPSDLSSVVLTAYS
jgi:hypothetical protein